MSALPCHQAIRNAVDAFEPIALKDMDNVELMDRFDYKLVFPVEALPRLLDGLRGSYRSLDVAGTRMSRYDNRYFDTPSRMFFLAHHNGKANRLKVRFRRYADSNVTFFEVKLKTNKGKTVKQRIKCDGIPESLNDTFRQMLRGFTDNQTIECLEPALDNGFRRITLVNKEFTDRFTLDTDVCFSGYGSQASLSNLVIAELKQDGAGIRPFLRDLFHGCGMAPLSVSKYVVGSLLLNPALKHNNFKKKLHLLNKLSHAA